MHAKSISDLNSAVDWSTSSGCAALATHSLYRHVLRFAKAHQPRSVLELGCHACQLLEYLRGRGVEVAGVDLQPSEHEYCSQADLNQPYGSGRKFDMVVAVEIVEHLVDTHTFLETIKHNLSPAGVAVVTTPNLVSFPNRWLMLFGRMPRFCYMDYHVRMFHPADLVAKARPHFGLVEEYGSHVLLGMRHGFWCVIFEWLARWFPRLACHTILVLREPLDAPHAGRPKSGAKEHLR